MHVISSQRTATLTRYNAPEIWVLIIRVGAAASAAWRAARYEDVPSVMSAYCAVQVAVQDLLDLLVERI